MDSLLLPLCIGVGCIVLGLYIRDKSLVIKENGKWSFRLVKTKNIKK